MSEYKLWPRVWPYSDPLTHLGDTSKYRPNDTPVFVGANANSQVPRETRASISLFMVCFQAGTSNASLQYLGIDAKDKDKAN